MRPSDCACRTSGDAARATAATFTLWRIGTELESRENLGEEEPRPQLRIDQHGAFAVPADSRLGRMIAFEHRSGVDITFLRSAVLAQQLVNRLQLFLDHFVIIIAPRVTSDSALWVVAFSTP